MTSIAKAVDVVFHTDEIQEQVATMQLELAQLRQQTLRLEQERNEAVAKADFYFGAYTELQNRKERN